MTRCRIGLDRRDFWFLDDIFQFFSGGLFFCFASGCVATFALVDIRVQRSRQEHVMRSGQGCVNGARTGGCCDGPGTVWVF